MYRRVDRQADKYKNLSNSSKRKGFTLAEILLTLTIIGIIASYTIPALTNTIKGKETTVQVQKIYSIMGQAFISLESDNGGDISPTFTDKNKFQVLTSFATKLNIIKNCGTDPGCFPDVIYLYLNKTEYANVNQDTASAKAIISDGMSVAFFTYSNCTTDRTASADQNSPLYNTCGKFLVDINGSKGPNIIGRDWFYFWITKRQLYPGGAYPDNMASNCTTNGLGCASKIILEGNMNY